MAKKANIELMFQNYLKKVNLDPTKMSKVQFTETRRAFMAGVSSLIVVMVDDISEMGEQNAFEYMEDISNQCETFWINESNL